MPSNSTSGTFANPMCERRLRSTPYVSGSNAFYPSCLSSWRFLVSQLTTIWQSAVCALWLLPAKSAAEHAAPKAAKHVRGWLLFFKLGLLSSSILFSSSSLSSPPHFRYGQSEQFHLVVCI